MRGGRPALVICLGLLCAAVGPAQTVGPAFQVDFDEGLDGQAPAAGAEGAPTVIAGKAGGNVTLVEGNRGKAAYIHATTVPGDYLYYRCDDRFRLLEHPDDCRPDHHDDCCAGCLHRR